MHNRLNPRERAHLARVKELPCSVCGAPGPSEAHHIKQGLQFGPVMGWHGQKRAWAVRKLDELDALNETIRNLEAA